MMYKLVASFKSGYNYEVMLTKSQAEHMLFLWGEQYNIWECTTYSPILSPSGSSRIELVVDYKMVAEG